MSSSLGSIHCRSEKLIRPYSEGERANKIKHGLPSKLQAFSFTFETKRPGPMTVEITLRWPTKRPRLLQVPEHVNLSATKPKTPNRLQVMRWQEAKKYQKSAARTVARIDTEETFDSSDTEKETPAEFFCWYKAKKASVDYRQMVSILTLAIYSYKPTVVA
ncbi:hypothetical protein BDR03DRAFT_986787 [Suillus americanus]|nr:hypothetical protein BDR03DRAFT_986787 [Suillus americanus]